MKMDIMAYPLWLKGSNYISTKSRKEKRWLGTHKCFFISSQLLIWARASILRSPYVKFNRLKWQSTVLKETNEIDIMWLKIIHQCLKINTFNVRMKIKTMPAQILFIIL
jgi:hypothetical protein